MTMLRHDEIVSEVRRNRSAILAEHGGNLRKLMDHMRQLDEEHPRKVVTKSQLDRRQKRGVAAAAKPR
jgi:bisphosphoglycerate-dependent phosphoglycerate mutase